jgi:hypothetical protein
MPLPLTSRHGRVEVSLRSGLYSAAMPVVRDWL